MVISLIAYSNKLNEDKKKFLQHNELSAIPSKLTISSSEKSCRKNKINTYTQLYYTYTSFFLANKQ